MDADCFRREHVLLGAHVEHLRLAAREIPELSPQERRELIGRVDEFLRDFLLRFEDDVERELYPQLAESAAVALRDEHAWIRRRVDELEAVDVDDGDAIQELLYALHAVVSLHFWKQEDLLALA